MTMSPSEIVTAEVSRMRRRVWQRGGSAGFIEFAKANIVIRPEESKDYQGPWSEEMILPQARLFDLWEREREEWSEMILAKGSQSGVTAQSLVVIVKTACEDPQNVLYVIHSQTEAKNISGRLDAFLEECKITGDILNEMDRDDNATLRKKLPGMNIWLTGAHSAGALASKQSVGLVVVDEVDKHPEIPGEASTLNLIRQRGKTVGAGRLLAYSTPTNDDGQIWKEVQTGSRHRYFVPCPFCGHMQWLNWRRLRFERWRDLAGHYDMEAVRSAAAYECMSCKKEIPMSYKKEMIEAGEWRPTNYRGVKDLDGTLDEMQTEMALGDAPKLEPAWDKGKMSVHLNDMTARWPGSSWGDIACEIVAARGDAGLMHNLLNNRFGEPWRRQFGLKVEERHVMACRAGYKRRSLPREMDMILMAADTQDDRWKWSIGGFCREGHLWILDYGEEFAWTDLVMRAMTGVDGKKAMLCIVDEGGHRTREVRKLVLAWHPMWTACKGRGGVQVKSTLEWRRHKVDHEDESSPEVDALHFDDDGFRQELYHHRILGKNPDDPKRLFLPQDVEERYVKELASENLVRALDNQGRPVYRWECNGPNDYGDTAKMLLVLRAVVASRA